jgi:hypothetical protein
MLVPVRAAVDAGLWKEGILTEGGFVAEVLD